MQTRLFASFLFAALAACHSSGDIGNPTVGVPGANFISFDALQANQTVNAAGTSSVVTGTLATGNVSTVSAAATDSAATTAKLTYDGARTLSGVSITTASGSISFSRGANDTFNCNAGTCTVTNAAGNASMIIMDPASMPTPSNFNYQTFGVWNRTTATNAFDAGVFSVGAATAATAVPTFGSATFNGLAKGWFAPSGGTAVFTTATMTATADFVARSISFSTTNTQTISISTGISAPNANLNLTGSFTYLAGTNAFGGPVRTVVGSTLPMTGSAAGQFFGPAAQEIGGVYNLSGAGVGSMIGSFGGK